MFSIGKGLIVDVYSLRGWKVTQSLMRENVTHSLRMGSVTHPFYKGVKRHSLIGEDSSIIIEGVH